MYRKNFVEVNLDNLESNFINIKKKFNNYEYFIAVVKSNGYGHGSYIAKSLVSCGASYLAVSNLTEALNIRKYDNEVPILCMEPIDISSVEVACENNITITISSLEYLNKLIGVFSSKDLLVHIKIDSGMNRLGINNKKDFNCAYDLICENYLLEGIYTHMQTIGYIDKKYDEQILKFKEITSDVDLSKIKMVHIGKSSTLFNHDKPDFVNSVRIGISLFGFDVSLKENFSFIGKLKKIKANYLIKKNNISKVNFNNNLDLKNTFSFFSEIIEIKNVRAGSYVGYGLRYKFLDDSIVGVVSTGYADGLKLSLTNHFVFINNKKYEIVGSINSGMIMVKIDGDVKLYDKVEIFGDNISIKRASLHAHTTPYDLISSVHESIPRVYKKNDETVYTESWEMK